MTPVAELEQSRPGEISCGEAVALTHLFQLSLRRLLRYRKGHHDREDRNHDHARQQSCQTGASSAPADKMLGPRPGPRRRLFAILVALKVSRETIRRSIAFILVLLQAH